LPVSCRIAAFGKGLLSVKDTKNPYGAYGCNRPQTIAAVHAMKSHVPRRGRAADSEASFPRIHDLCCDAYNGSSTLKNADSLHARRGWSTQNRQSPGRTIQSERESP
jgi:hypothetical protein